MPLISRLFKRNNPPKPVSMKFVGIGLVVIIVATVALQIHQRRDTSTVAITLGDTTVTAEVVHTLQTKARGLSGREHLAENAGMLFPYQGLVRPGFWMKEMNFPIDILWIKDGKIVDIALNVPPPAKDGELTTYYPKEPINAVLEVSAGFAERHGVTVGGTVTLEP